MTEPNQISELASEGFSTLEKTNVDVFAYTDYRLYLKEYYEHLKSKRQGFSYRFFAKQARLGSQSYLRMVIDGERNLTAASIAKFALGLKLNRKERAYFEAMVLYNQARDEIERERHYLQMLEARPRLNIEGLEKDRFEYVTNDLFVIIREMSALEVFKDDIEWIMHHLRRNIGAKEIRHALELLERLGFLVRDDHGHLKHSGKTIESVPEIDSVEILNYHRQVLSESKDNIMTAPYDEWDLSSITMPIPQNMLPKVMDMMKKCRDDIVMLINGSTEDFHEVFQINMQMYPVTKTKNVIKTP